MAQVEGSGTAATVPMTLPDCGVGEKVTEVLGSVAYESKYQPVPEKPLVPQ